MFRWRGAVDGKRRDRDAKLPDRAALAKGERRVTSLLDRISDAVARVAILAGAVAVGVMTLHVAAGIVSRAVFGASLTGTVEIVSYYYMVFIAFAPWAFAQSLREHIAVDALVGLMSERVRVATRIFATFASLAVTGFVAWALIDQAIRQTGYGEHVVSGIVDVPVWPARWVAVSGVVAMIVVLVAQLLDPAGIAAAERRREARHDDEVGL